ncbi:hypothetical protein [Citricoccus sp. I39-566]|uniref:hypothetical protein n=1 Tax=Citricoccus sp. I39-566 TaxID=3073268 RepID=UPI00286D4B3D|nr:hypothetical protein [Citricoccus sp. I39-566]WMY77902.1 hypothetical protein RE421_13905 [Citricoccus sp. I39-566]
MTRAEPEGSGPPGSRRRGPRRADAPGTGPASADGAEPQLEALKPEPASSESPRPEPSPGDAARKNPRLTEHDRWLLEQRPPHWG